MIDCYAIGRKIKDLRVQNKLNQDQLAERMYVSRQAISRWELGIALPTINNLIELSKIFSTSFEEILCLNEPVVFDSCDIFKGHDRQYIIRSILEGEIEVNILEVMDQFTGRERMQILKGIKEGKIMVQLDELRKKITPEEQYFLGNEVISYAN